MKENMMNYNNNIIDFISTDKETGITKPDKNMINKKDKNIRFNHNQDKETDITKPDKNMINITDENKKLIKIMYSHKWR